MRRFLALVVLLAPFATPKMPVEEFRARRANLRKALDGVLVLFGRVEGRDEVFRSDQEPNFYYLTGWSQPAARLLITPTEEILFLPHHNERAERFQGKRASAEDSGISTLTGFDQALPIETFETTPSKALA